MSLSRGWALVLCPYCTVRKPRFLLRTDVYHPLFFKVGYKKKP